MRTFQSTFIPAIVLRIACGTIALAMALSLVFAAQPVGAAAILTVTTTADIVPTTDGACSLREAILAANADATTNDCIHDGSPGTDTIQFAIPGAGLQTINVGSALPAITSPTVINGLTQSDASCASWPPTLRIELSGPGSGSFSGLQIDAGGAGSTIRGLVINSFPQNGILINGGSTNTIQCNFIGTNATGTAADSNVFNGIRIQSSDNNQIGGTTASARNLVSGNGSVAGGSSGIFVWSAGTPDNSSGNLIQGNYVGTNATLSGTIGNGSNGITIDNDGNTVGGPAAGAGNWISGNAFYGVLIRTTPSTSDPADDNLIQGNTITGNSTGGSAAGIAVAGAGLRNRILSNSISDNLVFGIDLGGGGFSANDAGDPDTGSNNLQNFPVLSSATIDTSGALVVQYNIDSLVSNSAYPIQVEIFEAASASDPEGRDPLGFYSAVAPGGQTATITIPNATLQALVNGDPIIANATDANGNTSEFSNIVALTRGSPGANLVPGAGLNLGNQAAGVPSAVQFATLESTGSGPLVVNNITLTAPFTRSGGTCPSSFPAIVTGGTSCTIGVVFTPTSTGAANGTLTVTDDASGSPRSIALSGTGVLPTATPSPITFGDQLVGLTSGPQTVTYGNSGTGAVQITGIATTGDFARSGGTCPASFPAAVAGGTSCTVEVTFTPTTTGARNGTLTISDNAQSSPRSVTLSGTGVLPGAAPSLSFTNQLVGVASAAQTVTYSNPGSGPVQITGISFTGDFARSGGDCPSAFPAVLAGGASCTIDVIFTPSAAGAANGTLSIADNAQGSPRTVNLSGTGVLPTIAPPTLTYTGEPIGTTSAAQTVTYTNPGTDPLQITGITLTGDFARSGGDCPATFPAALPAVTSCTIEVTFTPTAAGTRTGTLSVADNIQGSPRQVALSGAGLAADYESAPEPGETITLSSLIGSSNSTTIEVSNSGQAPLNVSAPGGVSGVFSVTPSTAYTLAVGSTTQTITITCTPTAAGPFTMNLSYTTNDPANPTVEYTITCTGTTVATPGYSSTPAPGATLALGSVTVGSATTTTLTVRETGDATLTLSNPVFGGAHASDFSIVAPPAFPLNILNGSADAELVIQCRPGGVGARTATLTITTNDPNNPTVTYTLTCSGTNAIVALPLIIAP